MKLPTWLEQNVYERNASKLNYIRNLFEEQEIKFNNKNNNSNSNLAKKLPSQKMYEGSTLPENNHNVLTWSYLPIQNLDMNSVYISMTKMLLLFSID